MAPPGGQQQSGSDNSLDMLWICGTLCIGVLLLWYFFHTQIVIGFLTFKLWEASLIELFTHQITPLKQSIQGADSKSVTFTQLIAVATEVGKYLRYPLCVILIVMAIRVYQRSATTRFCQIFNMKSLLRQELNNWPYAQIVINKDLVKEDIFTGPWAMAMTAMQFSRKYKLLDVERKQMGATALSRDMGYEAKINKYRAHKVFVKQLGELWGSIDELQPHRRALFAIFAAKAMGDRQSADKLLRQIALSAADPSLNLSGVDALLKKHKDEKILKEIINRHAFEYGVLAGMLELARADGVLASAEFLWLKPRDRVLWYVLNSVGRQTVFPEVAGIFAHFLAEKTIGYRLVSPMVEEAIAGLEEAIDEFMYVPSDEEKARLGRRIRMPRRPVQRGLESYQEQDPSLLIRDTRTLGQRIADFFTEPMNVALSLGFCAITGFVLPASMDILFLISIGIYFYQRSRKITLPFRLPQVSEQVDYGDMKPGSKEYNKARGIAFLGNDRKNNEELWFSNDDLRTHILIFGSTGSGKTEALVSIAYNALIYGSGFIYVDGKGDNSLFAKIFSMARSMGREDDLLIINFMTGARDIVGRQEKRISNTLNPFSNGSSSMLSQLVVSMMDSASASPDGDMWKGRAISFVEALMKILVYMRDQGHILLDAHTTRLYFSLEKLESIVVDKLFPREHQESVPLHNVPEVVMQPISHYLDNLPGYDKNKKGKQVSQVLEQHGFITMQLTRVFTSLADTYGHILRVKLAEVDLRDVVLNRRILVVLLPALEKAPDELANLGKVIISTLKAMMSAGLGSDVEGSYRELITRKPTNATTPFMCILDEYGYYAIEGFAVVPAQARSLGFSAIFAGQDLPAFQKSSKEEAASIGANTNIKICMKLEDPTETWEFFSKTAGESYVTKVDTFKPIRVV